MTATAAYAARATLVLSFNFKFGQFYGIILPATLIIPPDPCRNLYVPKGLENIINHFARFVNTLYEIRGKIGQKVGFANRSLQNSSVYNKIQISPFAPSLIILPSVSPSFVRESEGRFESFELIASLTIS